MKQWYRVHINGGFRGLDKPMFIFERDIVSVYDKFRRIRGVGDGYYGDRFPDIIPLSKEETLRLEDYIRSRRGITLSQAKRICYNPSLLGKKLWVDELL